MEDDVELQESPLSGTFIRDGTSIVIHIYRGSDDPTWLLEVVDENNASTVWDDRFPTDQAAYDEAMRTIEEEGIATFVNSAEEGPH